MGLWVVGDLHSVYILELNKEDLKAQSRDLRNSDASRLTYRILAYYLVLAAEWLSMKAQTRPQLCYTFSLAG